VDALLVDGEAGDIEVIVVLGEYTIVVEDDMDASAAESACETGGSIDKVEPAGRAREVYPMPVSGTGSGIEVVSAVSAFGLLAYFWLDLPTSSVPVLPEKSFG
jgi:hypothetical protein